MEGAETLFRRFERIAIGSGSLVMALVKNPVGFNQVLRTLGGADLIVIAINDLSADGTDLSWLWDVDFEVLAEKPVRFLCTGLRAHDMALRLKYAGVSSIEVDPYLSAAVEAALLAGQRGETVLVFPTYTA